MNFQLFFEMLEIMLQLVGFTAIGIARGPVELEGLDDANVVAENQETICYKGGLDDTEEIFIISADRQGADRGCEGDRDVVHVRVAVPHDRDRDALRCITITTSDQATHINKE